MVLLIFGALCNVIGLVLVLGAGHFRVRERIAFIKAKETNDEGEQPALEGSWSIATGGFLIIIGSAVMTYELMNRYA
ncbi:MAG: hypothetical protein H0V37_09140 [Chloroflexia bacterium]|nr:hypothetical protein [Chloroflexia bacterium]